MRFTGRVLVMGWLRRALLAVVVSVVLVVAGTAASIWWVARGDDRPRADAIVVLGAAQFNGRPGPLLVARLNHAKTLYDAGVAPRVVTVGGGGPGDQFTEAAAGARYLQQRGVRAVPVGEGRDTLQSLQAVNRRSAAEGWTRAVLVTDPWHSLRSRTMARDLGLQAVTSPARSGPAVLTRQVQVRYIGRETAAYLAYRLGTGASGAAGPDDAAGLSDVGGR